MPVKNVSAMAPVVTPYTTNALNQYPQVGDALYEFDADGNMVTKTDAGVITRYRYDAENRLVEVTGLVEKPDPAVASVTQ